MSKKVEIVTLDQLLAEEHSEKFVKELSFEQGLKLLEELVARVESGQLALDKAITSYEKGALVITQLRALLSGAEEKLKILQK